MRFSVDSGHGAIVMDATRWGALENAIYARVGNSKGVGSCLGCRANGAIIGPDRHDLMGTVCYV